METRKIIILSFVAAACPAFVVSAPTDVRAQDATPETTLWQPKPAEPFSGAYIAASFGSGAAADAQTSAGFEAEYGFEVGGDFGVGYAAGPIRAEAMLLLQQYDIFDINPEPASGIAAVQYGGWLNMAGVVANAYVNFDLSPRIRPYVGAGGGYGFVDAFYAESDCAAVCALGTKLVDDQDTVKLWQFMAGVAFPPNDRSGGLEAYMGYRYLRSTDMNFRLMDGTPFRHEGMEAHILEFGIRLAIP